MGAKNLSNGQIISLAFWGRKAHFNRQKQQLEINLRNAAKRIRYLMSEQTRFRYSREKLKLALITALGLTAMFTLVTWMVFAILWSSWANVAAISSSMVFLAFFSLKSGLIYWRDDAVLSIMPSGISDKRFPISVVGRHVSWSELRDVELVLREDTPQLVLRLWANARAPDTLAVEMSELDAAPGIIIAAISKYTPVKQFSES